jgi:hypothetical protein
LLSVWPSTPTTVVSAPPGPAHHRAHAACPASQPKRLRAYFPM